MCARDSALFVKEPNGCSGPVTEDVAVPILVLFFHTDGFVLLSGNVCVLGQGSPFVVQEVVRKIKPTVRVVPYTAAALSTQPRAKGSGG